MKNEAKTNQKTKTNLKKEREIEMHKNKQKNKQKKTDKIFFSKKKKSHFIRESDH